MTWISFVLWALLAPRLAGDAVEVGVLVHDPATDTVAVLRLRDRAAAGEEEIGAGQKVFVLRLCSAGAAQMPSTGARGFATGEPRAAERLAALAPAWADARVSVAAMIAGTGAAVFEGSACERCAAAHRSGVAVIGVGIDASAAEAIAIRVGAVGGDAIDRLLALADAADELWPHRRGPASATLVAIGQARARERIAVEDRGRIGRRLLAQHLQHLADVELPFQLEHARVSWADGDEAALAVHRRRALTAGRRALEAFPQDAVLLRRLREAEALRPEHDAPGP